MKNEEFSYEKQVDTFYTQLNCSSRLTDALLFSFPVNSFCQKLWVTFWILHLLVISKQIFATFYVFMLNHDSYQINFC